MGKPFSLEAHTSPFHIMCRHTSMGIKPPRTVTYELRCLYYPFRACSFQWEVVGGNGKEWEISERSGRKEWQGVRYIFYSESDRSGKGWEIQTYPQGKISNHRCKNWI